MMELFCRKIYQICRGSQTFQIYLKIDRKNEHETFKRLYN